jgi:hypothetical protein
MIKKVTIVLVTTLKPYPITNILSFTAMPWSTANKFKILKPAKVISEVSPACLLLYNRIICGINNKPLANKARAKTILINDVIICINIPTSH